MKPPKGGRKLTEGAPGKAIIELAIPMMAGMVALISYNIADTWFVSKLGTMQLAAISFTFPVAFIVGALVMSLGIGVSSVVARLFGAEELGEVKRIATHAMVLGVASGLAIALLGYLTIEPVFLLLGADETTLPLIHEYMSIYYFGGVFLVVPMMGNSVLRASGDTKTPAAIMTSAAIVNVILDPIFIFGYFGVPRMEIAGAAIATVLANVATLFVSVGVLHFRERLIAIHDFHAHKILDSWRRILHVGIPTLTSSLMAPVTTAFVTAQVARFGQEAVAGFGVSSRVEGLSLLVMMSVSAALTPFVGQNFGARRYDRVSGGLTFVNRFAQIYGLAVAVMLLFASSYVGRLFTEDPVALGASKLYLNIVPWTYGFLGMSMAANAAFNAMGKPVAAMFVSLSRTLLVYVPLAWILSQFFGLPGIFFAAACANVTAGLVGFTWFRSVLSAWLKTHETEATQNA